VALARGLVSGVEILYEISAGAGAPEVGGKIRFRKIQVKL